MELSIIIRSAKLKLFTSSLSPLTKANGSKKRTRGATAKMMPISLALYPDITNTFGIKMM